MNPSELKTVISNRESTLADLFSKLDSAKLNEVSVYAIVL